MTEKFAAKSFGNLELHLSDFQKFSVLGAARSGIAAAKLLTKNGRSVFLSEIGGAEKFLSQKEDLAALQIDHEFGQHTEKNFEADCLVVSPGISPTVPILKEAKDSGNQ